MATSAMVLTNGIGRTQNITVSLPTIYDQSLSVVSSGASGSNQINGPVSSGTSISLPMSQTYNSTELEIFINGQELENTYDYTYVGSVPRTQLQFTFTLLVNDRVDFRIYRNY